MTVIHLNASHAPDTFSPNSYSANNAIVEGGLLNRILRAIVPGYANRQDEKIALVFCKYFKEFLAKPALERRDECRSVINLSRQHLRRFLEKDVYTDNVPQGVADMERYLLAVRIQLKDFRSDEEEFGYREMCKSHCHPLYASWQKMGLSRGDAEETFLSTPDLVDFVMHTFLKSVLPQYPRGLDMAEVLSEEDGTAVREAHLLVEGRMTPWRKVRDQFISTENWYIHTKENGKKVHWWYFNEGMVRWDRRHWDNPRPMTVLAKAPDQCEVQIVTSHVKEENRVPVIDRYFDKVRHAFFRVVIREGFCKDHPESPFKDGEVYSFGYVPNNKDFSYSTPLATIRGDLMSPDYCEVGDEDLCVTPVALKDDQALIDLMNRIQTFTHEVHPYQWLDRNCTWSMNEILSGSGIALTADSPVSSILYQVFVPECIRKQIDKISAFFQRMVPSKVASALDYLQGFLHSLVVSPLFLALGAWRVRINPNEKDKSIQKLFQPYYSKVSDVLNPNKMTFKIPKTIYVSFQKDNPSSYFERH